MKNFAFDQLIENLSKKGFSCETHENYKDFIIPGSDRVFNSKIITCRINSLFFLAYDSYGTKAYSTETYTGLYTDVELPTLAECQIFKKDWIDFIRINKRKTGDIQLDKILTIISKNKWTPENIIPIESALKFVDLCSLINPLKLLIHNNYFNYHKDLFNKKILGLESNTWIYSIDELYPFLDKGEVILYNIKHACT